ncbi:MAG TPA: hypothetical protein VKC60_09455, partial [Opitutaceae bacterium]|nr:hypothetical protein [Opitutaceae bacterium]
VLWTIDYLIRVGSHIPAMHWAATFRSPWIGSLALALLIATCLLGASLGWQKKAPLRWFPLAVVILALVCGTSWV